MADRRPIAFLSYVRSDDDHDEGRITAFRKRLEGEVRMQSGETFEIFQDRNDIAWGQNWEERINTSLSDVSFLIPVVTPSFFKSPACRNEFRVFTLKENTLGINRLILPLYYVSCDELGDAYKKGSDEFADIVRSRNWTDWRPFRFKPLNDENVASAVADLATMIKNSMRELKALSQLSKIASSEGATPKTASRLPQILTEEEISTASDQEPPPSSDSTEGGANDTKSEKATPISKRTSTYRAFTKKFDEVVDANTLAEEAELIKLHKYLSRFSKALARIYGPSLNSLLTRFSPKEQSPSLAITILIDNSGSMRGTKITHVAAWCVLIGAWLERLRIPTEFLGFTTRAWKGGQSREAWLAADRPANPGRLNDLRHLIYKQFSTSMSAAAPTFGVMLREGLLKENIDGEAIEWATERLNQQPAKNKLIYVISDGAPVDDSTLSVNPVNYLERHLREVIDSTPDDIKLNAIGVEFDVARYYPNSVMLKEASELGPRFFEMLVNDVAFRESFASSREKKTYRFAIDERYDE